MPKYSVGVGLFGIYAGVLKNENEWKDKTQCTDQALEAVRDYLYDEFIKDGETSGGYEWKRKDGKVVELRVTVKEKSE
jgi:hypothetical protein